MEVIQYRMGKKFRRFIVTDKKKQDFWRMMAKNSSNFNEIETRIKGYDTKQKTIFKRIKTVLFDKKREQEA